MRFGSPSNTQIVSLGATLVLLAACSSSESPSDTSAHRGSSGDAGASAADTQTKPNGDAPKGGAALDGGSSPPPMFHLDAGTVADASPEPVSDAEACARSSAVATPVPAVIELVLDTSGSMRWAPGEERDPVDDERSKLDITQEALASALDDMPDDTAVGLYIYPGREDDVQGDCLAEQTSIEIAPLDSEHRARLETALSNARAEGGTPTHDAYHQALAELEASPVEGDRYVVVITDGVPTYAIDCIGTGTDPVNLDPLGTAAEAALGRGIRTFLVGSPGSEPARADLSEIASRAGTAPADCSHSGPEYCHFDMTTASDFGASLQKALEDIGSQTLACSYEIPAPPHGEELDPDRVNVRFTHAEAGSEDILRASPGACEVGWRYSDDGSRIVLCEPTCERLRNQADSKIEVLFGCATQVAPIR